MTPKKHILFQKTLKFKKQELNFKKLLKSIYKCYCFAKQDAQTSRTLTLISKTIQSLGNLVSSRSAQQPCKEQYTGQLYKQFCTEKHVDAVKHFLEVISTFGTQSNEDIIKEPVLLKEG